MARYMLDTKICIYLMKSQPQQVAQRFAKCYVGDILMSAITFAKLEYGVSVSPNREQERQNLLTVVEDIPVVPFDRAAASAYGPIRTATRDSRTDHLDKLIAAHPVSLDVVLITNNVNDFTRYPGLTIENWLYTQPPIDGVSADR